MSDTAYPGIILIPQNLVVPLRYDIAAAFWKFRFVPESIHLDNGVYQYRGECSEFDEVEEGSVLPEYRLFMSVGEEKEYRLERICA